MHVIPIKVDMDADALEMSQKQPKPFLRDLLMKYLVPQEFEI